MENLYIDMLSGFLMTAGIVIVFACTYALYQKQTQRKFVESIKFAENSVNNHARTSGISAEGKLTHPKHSCGATSFITSVLNKKKNTDNDLIIELGQSDDSFTYVPQTRPHGGGWFV